MIKSLKNFLPKFTLSRLSFGSLFFGSFLLLIFQNCSEVKLHPPNISVQASSAGVVCTQAPTDLERLHRFIFVFDSSQSIGGLDPALPGPPSTVGITRRIDGIRKLIDKYKDDDNFTISLGALYNNTMGFLPDLGSLPPIFPTVQSQCVFYKPRVAADYANLQIALDQLDQISRNTIGNTPFQSFFQNVGACIQADLSTNTNGVYSVVMVTDGAPTDLTQQEVRNQTRTLINVGKNNPDDPIAASRVNLIYYSLADLTEDEALLLNFSVSTAQAAGAYKSKLVVNSSLDVITYKEVIDALRPKYILKQFFATNMNAGITPSGLLAADSDADGITDSQEKSDGSNELKYSTIDGCSDLIRLRNGGKCPTSCFQGQEYMDSDHDGLSDCDDLNLSTDSFNFDRDGDGIPDGLEYRISSNALDPLDKDSDVDNDGSATLQEARRNTSVFVDDRRVSHNALVNASISQVADQNGESCYEIQIDGLQLFKTKAVTRTMSELQHEADANMIKLMFLQSPSDAVDGTTSLLYGYKILYYSDYKDGIVNGYGDISDKDFDLYTSGN